MLYFISCLGCIVPSEQYNSNEFKFGTGETHIAVKSLSPVVGGIQKTLRLGARKVVELCLRVLLLLRDATAMTALIKENI